MLLAHNIGFAPSHAPAWMSVICHLQVVHQKSVMKRQISIYKQRRFIVLIQGSVSCTCKNMCQRKEKRPCKRAGLHCGENCHCGSKANLYTHTNWVYQQNIYIVTLCVSFSSAATSRISCQSSKLQRFKSSSITDNDYCKQQAFKIYFC